MASIRTVQMSHEPGTGSRCSVYLPRSPAEPAIPQHRTGRWQSSGVERGGRRNTSNNRHQPILPRLSDSSNSTSLNWLTSRSRQNARKLSMIRWGPGAVVYLAARSAHEFRHPIVAASLVLRELRGRRRRHVERFEPGQVQTGRTGWRIPGSLTAYIRIAIARGATRIWA